MEKINTPRETFFNILVSRQEFEPGPPPQIKVTANLIRQTFIQST